MVIFQNPVKAAIIKATHDVAVYYAKMCKCRHPRHEHSLEGCHVGKYDGDIRPVCECQGFRDVGKQGR